MAEWLLYHHAEGLFLAFFEGYILVTSAFAVQQLNLIASDIRLIDIAHLVLVLHSNEDNQEPFVDYGMIVEVDSLYHLVLLMLVLCHYLYPVLLLEARLVVLS